MIPIEKKLDAIIRHLTAETDAEKKKTLVALRQIAADLEMVPDDRSLEYDVCQILLDIGVPEHIKGYRCLVMAICIACQHPELSVRITKEIYPAVAKELGSMPGRVERDIRHAIEIAWDRCDLDTLRRYFGNTVSPLKGRPTNSEFIARIANIVRQYQQ